MANAYHVANKSHKYEEKWYELCLHMHTHTHRMSSFSDGV